MSNKDKIKMILNGGKPTLSDSKKIEAIKNWYDLDCSNPNFNFDLIESFEQRLSSDVPLTEKQKQTLDKIIKGFDINPGKYL